MRNLAASVLILMLFWVAPVAAHDIGISQAELVELDGKRYELSVRTGPANSFLFATPQLPEHCEFGGNPRGTQGPSWKTFEFSCANGLSADDTLKLPWRRDGTVLTQPGWMVVRSSACFRTRPGR